MNGRKHWNEIDWLYTIGILLVLIGHSHSSDWSTFRGTVLAGVIGFIYTFHMPLFFLIAGFLFQNSDPLAEVSFGKWIGQRAARLLIPYVFWTLVTVVPKHLFLYRSLDGLSLTYLFRICFFPRENVWGHFWFLPVMFLAYLFFGILRKLAGGQSDLRFLCLSLLSALGAYLLPITSGFLGLADLHTSLLFFAIGMLLCRVLRTENARRFETSGRSRRTLYWCVFVSCSAISAVLWRLRTVAPATKYLLPFLMLPSLWALASLLPPSRAAAWFGRNSLTIYLFSWFYQAAAMILFERLRFHWAGLCAGMFLAGAIGAVGTALVVSKVPFLRGNYVARLLGKRSSRI